jgi:hypothetical protein
MTGGQTTGGQMTGGQMTGGQTTGDQMTGDQTPDKILAVTTTPEATANQKALGGGVTNTGSARGFLAATASQAPPT